jgi:ribonuclease P protein component
VNAGGTEGADPRVGQRLPRSARVRRGVEIRRLLRNGRRMRAGQLDLFISGSSASHPRFGIIVPRYGRTVVERNLLRRRLREIGRQEVLPRLRARDRKLDILVRTRPGTYGSSFQDLRSDLIRITERLCSDASPSG